MQITTATEPSPNSTPDLGPELADVIIPADDDLTWRRRCIPGATR